MHNDYAIPLGCESWMSQFTLMRGIVSPFVTLGKLGHPTFKLDASAIYTMVMLLFIRMRTVLFRPGGT